ncbi:beta-lactamase class C [Sphingomonas jejuensis]|uniref:Beta-lactamase class C n=1 Tax=Sphingomonas jejuensis TaxID=904715 RepID=A0ABX0XKS7_9SPHN|nr:serine hydrolase domain-containing protein [Sphingomonas jejuensis]NJC33814.1 beta-lactamase class C [Sphingomonas jejuensis]
MNDGGTPTRRAGSLGTVAAALLLGAGAVLGLPSLLSPGTAAPAHAAEGDDLVRPTGRSIPASALQAPSRIDYRRLDDRITRLAQQPEIVGLAVAVIENGEISFLKGYGTTQASGGQLVRPDTVFRWASLSKGVASTAIGMLANDGRLSLTDPVARYAQSLRLPGGGEGVATIADVLSHRVGLYANAYDDRLESGQDPKRIRASLGQLRPICAVSTCHGYQNVAFDAASEVVEQVTGRSYQSVVRDRIFAPLGMANASLTRIELVNSPSWARPHVGRREVEVTEPYYRVPAAGGVNGSIFDLALWMRAQMGREPAVLSERLLEEIHQPRVASPRRGSAFSRAMEDGRYALGWRDYRFHGHRLVGHQGAVRGYRSAILFDPATKAGVALLWNSQSGRPNGIQIEVMEALYGLPRGDWLQLDAAGAPTPVTMTTR